MYTLLSINSHTAYHYLLAKLPCTIDVVNGWDEKSRDKPGNITLIPEKDAKLNIRKKKYHAILIHRRIDDLWYILRGMMNRTPVLLAFHNKDTRSPYKRKRLYVLFKSMYNFLILKSISNVFNLTFVFIQPAVKASFGMKGSVIEPGIDIHDFEIWDPQNKKVLLVGNNLMRHEFAFDMILRLINDFETTVIGITKNLPKSRPAANFMELKNQYKTSFVFANLLKEPECGYNLSTLEAMATGMPVISLKHPESPIRNGYNGIVIKNYEELAEKIRFLLNNPDLAKKLGENARNTIETFFRMDDFIVNWMEAIENAIKKNT
jgi:glycosyltransferase involved in cell wall biosynthesis